MRSLEKKKSAFNVKKIIRILHLWLGLVTGIIVFVVSLTGTIWVFCDEIIDAVAGEAKYVEVPIDKNKKSTENLINIFKNNNPNKVIFYFDAYRDSSRSFRIATMEKIKSEDPREKKRGLLTYNYINPYTGATIKSTASYEFFYVIAHIHSQLLLNKLGQNIVAISTIIFFIQLLGGLVLWWPKKWTKATKKSAFGIKKNANWRRRNYDFHNVFGFYAVIPAIVITITGLIMAYEILGSLTQKAFGGNPNVEKIIEKYEPAFSKDKKVKSLQSIIDSTFLVAPNMKQMRLNVPAKDSVTTYSTYLAEYVGIKSQVGGSTYLTDKYTGKPISLPKDVEKHEIITSTNFDIHTGYWGGYLGKIFTFLVGIICTSLPITGFLIWWGRKYKTVKK